MKLFSKSGQIPANALAGSGATCQRKSAKEMQELKFLPPKGEKIHE